jgi:hypothetical protein
MTYFPPTYFPGAYFGEGYWRGITGSTSLACSGTGIASGGAILPAVASGGGKKKKRRRAQYYLPIYSQELTIVRPLLLASDGVATATGQATATIGQHLGAADQTAAAGGAELAMRQDYTETDNAFWAMAA